MDFAGLSSWLLKHGIAEKAAVYLAYTILTLELVLICIIGDLVIKKLILKLLKKIILGNKFNWDNIMWEHKVFHRLANLFPGIVIYIFAPLYGKSAGIIHRAASVYLLVAVAMIFSSLLNAVDSIYRHYPISNIRPIKGLLQVVKIVFFIIIGIVIIGTLMNQNPLILLGGIGAFAAVFSFVFKDSILGFIAGIQLTSNDLLRIGDWIEVPKAGADGYVIDITLNTVKVQNFDKTIVTIPAYTLVSDSFKNWRGMAESGGRRIKRAIYIDLSSICFCTPEMIEKFKKINHIREYMENKIRELDTYNKSISMEENLKINGRHMTNIGTFRAYIQHYLNNHPKLQKQMTIMVRQLPPGETGLPLEIYAFTNTTNWVEYENIQSDIFDHILSIAEEFGLRLFQNPTGHDMKQISLNREDKAKNII